MPLVVLIPVAVDPDPPPGTPPPVPNPQPTLDAIIQPPHYERADLSIVPRVVDHPGIVELYRKVNGQFERVAFASDIISGLSITVSLLNLDSLNFSVPSDMFTVTSFDATAGNLSELQTRWDKLGGFVTDPVVDQPDTSNDPVLNAAFSFSAPSLTVTFTDESIDGPSGPITQWHWDFGDTNTSTSQNPSHTYASYGTHTVTLVVTSVDGTDSVSTTVTIVNPATLDADFSVTSSALTITVHDEAVAGPSGPITAWHYDFGDGATSTSASPSHTYASAGTYTVTQLVTGTSPDGTDSVSHTVVVSGGITVGPSGIAIPNSNLPGWNLHFTDDFLTNCSLGDFPIHGVTNPSTPAEVAGKWTSYPDSYEVTRKGVGGFYRTERTVSISGSVLSIHMHYDSSINQYCCAAPIPRLNPSGSWFNAGSYPYGRYEVCLRQLAPSDSYKMAWLLWPDSGDSSIDGQIASPDHILTEANNVHGFVHHAPASSQPQTAIDLGVKLNTWHTFVIERAPGSVKFYTDGVLKGQTTTHLPATNMHWVLQSELALGTAPLSHSDEVTLQCDWVAFWTKS